MPETSGPRIEASDVHKRYGRVTALAGAHIAVEAGSALGLLGPNGAGKSTLVKVLCGLVLPTSGEAFVLGNRAGTREARAAIGYLAELFRFPPWMRVHEVLRLHQELAGSNGGSKELEQLLSRVELLHVGDRRVSQLSKGMQQRLGIAQALLGNPPVVILDEPTSALDPAGRRMVRDLIADLRNGGTAVLLSSHLLAEVEQTCDRIAILGNGRILASGSLAELAAVPRVTIVSDRGASTLDIEREEIPGLLAARLEAGERIYEVRYSEFDLEAAYLGLVGDAGLGDASANTGAVPER